jgi:hypothetical protein
MIQFDKRADKIFIPSEAVKKLALRCGKRIKHFGFGICKL